MSCFMVLTTRRHQACLRDHPCSHIDRSDHHRAKAEWQHGSFLTPEILMFSIHPSCSSYEGLCVDTACTPCVGATTHTYVSTLQLLIT